MSEYGKKGGTSKNSGKKVTTYIVTLPDGSIATKKSFEIDSVRAYAGIFFSEKDGKWLVSGITSEPKDWPGQTFVEAISKSLYMALSYTRAVTEGMKCAKRKG